MASQVDICNLALSFLGSATITALTDNSNAARVLNAEYVVVRDSELRKHWWRFAITRVNLSALRSVPAFGPYTQQFQLPVDCLSVIQVGTSYPGADLSDYRTGPTTDDYLIEGKLVLSNLPAPLGLRYVAQVVDTSAYAADFVTAFAAMLAWKCCERLTQSEAKRKLAMTEYQEALRSAVRSNAIEKPPEFPADSSWVLARLQ